MLLYDDMSKATVDSPVVQPPQKLMILQNTTDGFEIAEADLALRGRGDFFGFRQSGFSGYRAAVLTEHAYLLPVAQKMVQEMKLEVHGDHINGLMALFPEPSPLGSAAPVVASSMPTPVSSVKATSLTTAKKTMRGVQTLAVDLTASSPPSKNALVVLLDLETTGFSPKGDRIIQIAAKAFGDQSVETFSVYVRPEGVALSSEIVKLTGITQKRLDDEGVAFDTAWQHFQRWLQIASSGGSGGSGGEDFRPIVVMAHNGEKFDIPFVGYELARHGFVSLTDCENWGAFYNITCFIDSVKMFRNADIWESRRVALGIERSAKFAPDQKSLISLYTFVTGKTLVGAHNGVNDVKALEEILDSPGFSHIWREHANKFQTVHFVRRK